MGQKKHIGNVQILGVLNVDTNDLNHEKTGRICFFEFINITDIKISKRAFSLQLKKKKFCWKMFKKKKEVK